MSGSQVAQPGALFLVGDEIMNKFYMLVAALLLTSTTTAAEPAPTPAPPTVEEQAATAAAKAAEEVRTTAARVAERAAEAARRSTLTFTEARAEDLVRVWNGTKWVICQGTRGVSNADHYTARAVGRPAEWVAERASAAATSCGVAAASIK